MIQNRTPERHPAQTLVMLIDDEKMDQMMYKRILSRSGYVDQVRSFPTAMDALDYLRNPDSPRPDLIFLDINMPRMNGFQFLDAAIEEFGTDFTTAIVIMLTTSLDPDDKKRAEKYDVVKEFVNKPLNAAVLEELKVYFDGAKTASNEAQ